jgi:hypothetical protein
MEHRAVTAPLQYSAFVSYSRRDSRIASRLQRRIEGYRLPHRITAHGKKRLRPVFRDRDDLTAASDLSEALRAALRSSEYLIVVCTPNAPQSEWVGREIDYFRALRGDDHILTALFEGSDETSFHEALLHRRDGSRAHPLAADFCRGGDGRLAFLKLVAVLAHVGLDELVQRDAKRRVQQIMALAAAALIIVIGVASLIIATFRARAVAAAERARNAAAIEFQLTEMRSKLQAAGRLDLLAEVNRGVAHFYAGRDPATLSVKEQLDRAKLMQANADDDLERGNYASAREAVGEASVITRNLIQLHPTDAQVVYADSQSEYYLGKCDWKLGALANARVHFERYADLARLLVAIDPADADWRLERAYSRSNLASLFLVGSADAARARPLFEAAQADMLAVAHERPNDTDLRYEIADGEGWLASTAMVAKNYDEAVRRRYAQLAILDALIRKSPRDARYIGAQIGAFIGLGRAAAAQSAFATAQRRYDQALAVSAVRLANAPDNDALARLARTVVLLKVQTWLAMQPTERPSPAAIVRMLGDCSVEWRKAANQELATFCSIEEARVRLLLHDRAGAEQAVAAAQRGISSGEALARLWDVNLSADIKNVMNALHSTSAGT